MAYIHVRHPRAKARVPLRYPAQLWTHTVRPKYEERGCPESYIRNLMKNMG